MLQKIGGWNSCSFHGTCFQSKAVPISVNRNQVKHSLSEAKQKQEQEQKDNEQSKVEGADRASVITCNPLIQDLFRCKI